MFANWKESLPKIKFLFGQATINLLARWHSSFHFNIFLQPILMIIISSQADPRLQIILLYSIVTFDYIKSPSILCGTSVHCSRQLTYCCCGLSLRLGIQYKVLDSNLARPVNLQWWRRRSPINWDPLNWRWQSTASGGTHLWHLSFT